MTWLPPDPEPMDPVERRARAMHDGVWVRGKFAWDELAESVRERYRRDAAAELARDARGCLSCGVRMGAPHTDACVFSPDATTQQERDRRFDARLKAERDARDRGEPNRLERGDRP